MRKHLVSILLALTIFIGGCNLRPSNVLSRNKMIDVSTDVLLVDAYVQDRYLSDSAVKLLYEGVFAQHNITRADYDSSLVWYGMNTEKFSSVYEEIQRRATEQRDLLDSLYNDSIYEARIRYMDVNDLWETTQHRILIPRDETYFAYKRFVTASDTISGKDTIKWSMHFLPRLYKGEEVILSMYIQEEGKKHTYYRNADTIRQPLHSHEFSFVLPDTLPSAYKMHFRLSYFRGDSVRRSLPLLLDRIRLYSSRYIIPTDTITETLPDTIPTPSTDSLELSAPAETDLEVRQESSDLLTE